jgi:hypothetical protein
MTRMGWHIGFILADRTVGLLGYGSMCQTISLNRMYQHSRSDRGSDGDAVTHEHQAAGTPPRSRSRKRDARNELRGT